MARRTLLVAYIATYMIALGTTIRYLTVFRSDRIWLFAPWLIGYLILLVLERTMSHMVYCWRLPAGMGKMRKLLV